MQICALRCTFGGDDLLDWGNKGFLVDNQFTVEKFEPKLGNTKCILNILK